MLTKQSVEEARLRIESLSKDPPVFLIGFLISLAFIALFEILVYFMQASDFVNSLTASLYEEQSLKEQPTIINDLVEILTKGKEEPEAWIGFIAFLLPFSPGLIRALLTGMASLAIGIPDFVMHALSMFEFILRIPLNLLISANINRLKEIRIHARKLRIYYLNSFFRRIENKISILRNRGLDFIKITDKSSHRYKRSVTIGYYVILFMLPIIASGISGNGFTEERYLASKSFLEAFLTHVFLLILTACVFAIGHMLQFVKDRYVRQKDPDSYLIDSIARCIKMVENESAWRISTQRAAIKKELEKIADLVDLVVPDNSFLADANEYKNYSFAISSRFYSLGQWTLAPRKDTRETLEKTLNEILDLFVDRDMDGIIALSIEPTLKSFPKRSLRAKVKNNSARLLRAAAPSLLVILFWKLSDSANNGAFISLAVYGFMFSVIIFLSEIDPKLKDNISYFINFKFLNR